MPPREGMQDRLREGDPARHRAPRPTSAASSADERRVRQVLFNLLSNAVGFSPPGESVRARGERRDDAVVFSVTDHGPGIPPEMQDSVFDWFETHALGSRHRGAGLGLSIVRSFVELHGGTVDARFRRRPRHHRHLHLPDQACGPRGRGIGA